MRVAIVEDQDQDYALLKEYLTTYGKENGTVMEVTHFSNGLNFIEEYRPVFDIIFMDIEMPHLNGMEAAKRLRDVDMDVALIFVTNMLQYAIHGYEVNAVDFIVKPVSYFNFRQKLTKALRQMVRREQKNLVVHTEDNTRVIPAKDIYYIEKDKNYLLLHTVRGTFRERGTIQEIAEELTESGFSRCFSSCLVNLAYVTEIGKDTLNVQGDVLPISRRQKKDFMVDFARFYGGNL